MGCRVIDIKPADERIGIKHWAEADRPREKLMGHGRRHLTDAELIAILIGSGSRNETAVDLSKRMLAAYGHDLNQLGMLSVRDLCRFKGIGEAKAMSVVAALELGRRRSELPVPECSKLECSRDAYRALHPHLSDLDHEEFWILILNRGNLIKGLKLISHGGQSATIADPKMIFRTALENGAAYIILAHNHPSGSVKPSSEDIELTKRLRNAGRVLGVPVIDHLIIGSAGYCSFRDEGLLD
ncbi:DNA repair protein RadC [Pedobacter sp. SYP-B3415]|uniref:RadC family protein n=1 Tax=Pedobacter sp. SYP-B3415 TaxID=2496641 RepID=UPI0013E9EBE9|nr:DNA repair protein RadC [Pedobacter sp. SYP-B3415]